MGFTDLPLVDSVIEQVNLLETRFENQLMPGLAYTAVAERFPIKARTGETITLQRPSLFPLGANAAVLNPATRTGLDNGLTPQVFGYEQVQIAAQEWALASDVSLEQEQVLVASLVVQTLDNLAQNAAATFDQNISITAHTAYDAGNSFATAAEISGATTVHLDNINGFTTAYSTVANSSPGLPQPVSASNPITAKVYNGSTGALEGTVTVTGFTADATNTSTANVNGTAYGVSGNLTLTATTFAINAGDNIVAVDGAFIQRPNSKLSRYQLASTDTLSLVTLADAAAKLKARSVKPMSNGLYAAIVDPLILPQLVNDTAFQRAFQGGLETMKYFRQGIPLPMYGIEIVASQMVPYFTLPAGGSASGEGVARHAVVVGAGAFLKSPYEGLAAAVRQVENARRGVTQIRPMAEDIFLVLRQPIDRLGDVMSMLWKWTGGFQAMTDVTSTPLQIPTSDYSRYKRAVVVEVYSAS